MLSVFAATIAPMLAHSVPWWRGDAHPATQAVIELLTTLYRTG